MADQHTRFERWASRLPEHAAYLFGQVQLKVVPVLRASGFSEAFPSYGKAREGLLRISAVPFQIRGGAEWPTAEIFFSPDGKPWFRIELAWLRDGLTDRDGRTWPLEQCVLHDAREYFEVAKDRGTVSSLFSQFGYHWWALMPRRKLDTEVAMAVRALSSALPIFFQGPAGIGQAAICSTDGYVANNLVRRRLPD